MRRTRREDRTSWSEGMSAALKAAGARMERRRSPAAEERDEWLEVAVWLAMGFPVDQCAEVRLASWSFAG